MVLLQILAVLLGLVVLLVYLRSIVNVGLLSRHRRDFILMMVTTFVYKALGPFVRRDGGGG